jgi:hypothetical protein
MQSSGAVRRRGAERPPGSEMIRRLNLAGRGAGDEAPLLLAFRNRCLIKRVACETWPNFCVSESFTRYRSYGSIGVKYLTRLGTEISISFVDSGR